MKTQNRRTEDWRKKRQKAEEKHFRKYICNKQDVEKKKTEKKIKNKEEEEKVGNADAQQKRGEMKRQRQKKRKTEKKPKIE